MLTSPDLLRSLLPLGLFVLLSLLAYVKVAIVLQVLRRGLGGGVPPLLVTVVLGLTLATLSMSPLCKRSLAALSAAPSSASQQRSCGKPGPRRCRSSSKSTPQLATERRCKP
jgi:flagellar biosynthesis protein FliP